MRSRYPGGDGQGKEGGGWPAVWRRVAGVVVPGSVVGWVLGRLVWAHSGGGLVRLGVGGKGQDAANWWQALTCPWAVYQPKGAADFAASLLDLSGNGNHAVDPGGGDTPGWGADGWDLTLGDDYLTTTFVPQNDQSQTVLIQYTNATIANDKIFGQADGVSREFNIELFGSNIGYRNGNIALSGAGSPVAGNVGIAGNQGYLNGAAVGGAIGAWAGAAFQTCYIGCAQIGGAVDFQSAKIAALVICDCVEAAGIMAAVAAGMAAL